MADQHSDLLASLRATRDGYDESVRRDQFYLDAYTGLGGFQGDVAGPDWAQWPRAWSSSTARQTSVGYVPQSTTPSYLVQFHRESPEKYRSRIRIAHYPGYVRTVTDLKLSFLLRRPFSRTGDGPWADWYEDTDGASTTWDEALPQIVLRAATLGWCPCLIDAPRSGAEGGSISVAQARDAGILPRLIPLFPANLRDWQTNAAGELEWAKVRTDHVERDSWRDAPSCVETYTIWTRETWSRYRVRPGNGGDTVEQNPDEQDVPHGWGRVPIAILRHTPSPDDSVRGLPMHSDVAVEAWRLFNLISERDEHVRGQVFSILTMAANFAQGGLTDPSAPKDGSKQPIGSGNVLQYHHAWPPPAFIAPPASVAATLAEAILASITELYRLARVEFARGVASATSGVARAYEFAQTGRALADFAGQIARWHEDVLDLTGMTLGVSGEARAGARVTPPDDFDVQDLAGRIEQATAALAIKLGPAAEREIKSRLVDTLLPNLDPEKREDIDQDLAADEAAAVEAAKAAAAARANPPQAPPPLGMRPRPSNGAMPPGAPAQPPPNGQPAAPSA